MNEFDVVAGALRDPCARHSFDDLVRRGAEPAELSSVLEDVFLAGMHLRRSRLFRQNSMGYFSPALSKKERQALVARCRRLVADLLARQDRLEASDAVTALEDLVTQLTSPLAPAFGFETTGLDFEEVLRHQERRLFEYLRGKEVVSGRGEPSVFEAVSKILTAGYQALKTKLPPVSLEPDALKLRDHRAKGMRGDELIPLESFLDSARLRHATGKISLA